MTHIRKRSGWVYLLPVLHFCVYVISMLGLIDPALQNLGIVGAFIMLADLPVSLVAYALAWKHSSLAALWILLVGTLWWYLLSRGAEFVFDKFRERNAEVQFSSRDN
jgi:hypothetical protein